MDDNSTITEIDEDNFELFSINNKWFYFDITKVENTIFSRRNGYRGKILFGYSVLFYFKKNK